MTKTKEIVPHEIIMSKIYLIRGQKVMLDRDIAELYSVSTKVLNQAVKRNKKRFPEMFAFKLTDKEKVELVTNCDRFKTLKHSTSNPYAFTEQGVLMLSSVLNSEKAIQINIQIVKIFVRLRQMIQENEALSQRMNNVENKLGTHERAIIKLIQEMGQKETTKKPKIGFEIGDCLC